MRGRKIRKFPEEAAGRPEWKRWRTAQRRGPQAAPYQKKQYADQLFSWKLFPQFRQVTVILPLPRGTRSCCPQWGHRK